jgi:hypothetical protein
MGIAWRLKAFVGAGFAGIRTNTPGTFNFQG